MTDERPFREITRETMAATHTFVGTALKALKKRHGLVHEEAAGAIAPVLLAAAVRLASEARVPPSAVRGWVEDNVAACPFGKEGKA